MALKLHLQQPESLFRETLLFLATHCNSANPRREDWLPGLGTRPKQQDKVAVQVLLLSKVPTTVSTATVPSGAGAPPTSSAGDWSYACKLACMIWSVLKNNCLESNRRDRADILEMDLPSIIAMALE